METQGKKEGEKEGGGESEAVIHKMSQTESLKLSMWRPTTAVQMERKLNLQALQSSAYY